jgi:hypothetical protein
MGILKLLSMNRICLPSFFFTAVPSFSYVFRVFFHSGSVIVLCLSVFFHSGSVIVLCLPSFFHSGSVIVLCLPSFFFTTVPSFSYVFRVFFSQRFRHCLMCFCFFFTAVPSLSYVFRVFFHSGSVIVGCDSTCLLQSFQLVPRNILTTLRIKWATWFTGINFSYVLLCDIAVCSVSVSGVGTSNCTARTLIK